MAHPEPLSHREELSEAARLLARGEEARVVELCDRILALHPNDAEALCMRGMALRMLGTKMLEAAGLNFEQSIAADPHYPKPHYQSIRLARSLDRLEGTIHMYKRRILENRVDPRNYAYLAFALLMAGDPVNALQVVETGLAVGPTDPYLHFTCGEVLRAQGESESAIAAWRNALQYDPEMVDAWYALAEAYEEAGRLIDAEGAWLRLRAVLTGRGAPAEQLAEVDGRLKRLQLDTP